MHDGKIVEQLEFDREVDAFAHDDRV
jgi:hypothetical protein